MKTNEQVETVADLLAFLSHQPTLESEMFTDNVGITFPDGSELSVAWNTLSGSSRNGIYSALVETWEFDRFGDPVSNPKSFRDIESVIQEIKNKLGQ